MTTALDTNILLDLLLADTDHLETSRRAFERASRASDLVVCEVVYAELFGHFSSRTICDGFLADAGIRFDPSGQDALFFAGHAWQDYRRNGGKRVRVLADFMIAGHAFAQASCLLTRDRGFYRPYFSELAIVEP